MTDPIPFPISRRAMATRDLVAKAEAIRADNLRKLHPDDRGMIEGGVEFVPLHRAMPLARATHASHRARRGLGHTVGVAIARVAEALASPRFILFYLGFYAGCMATVALALVWVKVLS
jgi:hypothetical protein